MRREERKKTGGEGRVSIEPSSGNVFADLGLKDPEELLAKAELVQRICDIITERKLTQTRAADLLGIDQPKVSALMRGKLDGFSLDRLFRFLNALGRDVEIVIRPARREGEAGTRVITA
jgi:predicted XRE-type DNA-binding protein